MGKTAAAPLFTAGGNRYASGVIVDKKLGVKTWVDSRTGVTKTNDLIVFEDGSTFEIASNWHPKADRFPEGVLPNTEISVAYEYGHRSDGTSGMNYDMAPGLDGCVTADEERPEF